MEPQPEKPPEQSPQEPAATPKPERPMVSTPVPFRESDRTLPHLPEVEAYVPPKRRKRR